MKNKLIILFLSFIIFSSFVSAGAQYGEAIISENYEISRDKIHRIVKEGNILEDSIRVENKLNLPLKIEFSIEGDASEFITLEKSQLTIEPKNISELSFYIKGIEIGNYQGKVKLSGGVSEIIPINLSIVDYSLDPLLLVDLHLIKNKFLLTKEIEARIDITKLKPEDVNDVFFEYKMVGISNDTIFLGKEILNITSSTQILKDFDFPDNLTSGYYTLTVTTNYGDKLIYSESLFLAEIPFMKRKLFGVFPVWTIFVFISSILTIIIIILLILRHIKNSKKYKMTLDMKTLEKPNKKFLWLGKIAERKKMAYIDPHKLTTHCIVAGATGGGKSIAAQDIIEEALKQNVCVIVFDPTAQWSGMLRKCDDKKMFALYPEFGMKKTDARGFPGNIRAVQDARQVIDIEKYFEPGHIQIFTLNKLQPKDMDIFIANIIRQIFKSDPKEYPTLRTLLVFDEIHRILPKFGGTGEGFVQIERACREFRKWGYGVALISQVLSDFAGQIKANISTEVQMRTRDEGDLNRIKTKYGDEFLQSLVKASVGVGMVVNPAYNHANPYFVQFRPILHNTRRLSDEELQKYNKYNDKVDEFENQLEQLEVLKVDVFDLKMEIKLVKDKIMTGNFSVVDIYLEGIEPRMAKQWSKLGKKPKKREVKLVDLEKIKASVAEAKAESDKAKEVAAAEEKAIADKNFDPMEELNEKIVSPLTFDNGAMISCLKELKQYMPILDDETFAIHVNEEKNEIAKWLEQISKSFGARMSSVKDKKELIKQINAWDGKEKSVIPTKKTTKPKPTSKKPASPKPKAKPKPAKPKTKSSKK
ncbi:DUF87 domain-containing protein [Candidatus Pacearchaeota archaeon]|nr:DUF87 domain-containing protein [Candidatus Pacearchaeota archaeon]